VIADVARRFAGARTALCATATGVAQTTTGTVGEWLGMVLNLITDRVDRPGGRRYEPGVVDIARLFSLIAPPVEHRTRLRGTPMVAGYHALAELPDEITTPGPGQIRALFIDAGNPVVAGPEGRALDEALASLELLVAVDLVQRESHRHAHWLIPAAHWLERAELNPLVCGVQDEPFIQYWRQAVEPPAGIRDEWEFFTDLALALDRNLFGKPGVNTVIRASRALARRTGRPGLALNPEWVSRLLVLLGRKVRWKEAVRHEHGWVFGPRRCGQFAASLRTPARKVDMADPELLAEARRLLAEMPAGPPADRPFQLVNRRRTSGMNSWLNDLPSLAGRHPTNHVELHTLDAVTLGISDGDLVALSSPAGRIELPARVVDGIRPGTVCVDHGFGSRVFDPTSGEEGIALGANRNALVPNRLVDPLSGTAGLNGAWVDVRPVVPDTADVIDLERESEPLG
jgi:formate dehydrogenase